jgi:hypothetical protein
MSIANRRKSPVLEESQGFGGIEASDGQKKIKTR